MSAATATRPASAPLLQVDGLTKRFAGSCALDGVSFALAPGEILAIVGANGSGKSTLVKVLAGIHAPDRGSSVVTAPDVELHFIHQDLGLVASMSVVENLSLGWQAGGNPLRPTSLRAQVARARALLDGFGVSIDVTALVATLTAAERTVVAIARALDGWTRERHVLVLDEPTAALDEAEVRVLFDAVRRVADAGAGVIFISHHLDEVVRIAHRVVALRDGRKLADVAVGELDDDDLVRLVAVGGVTTTVRSAGLKTETVLRVTGLAGASVRQLGLELDRGEILGVTGILGSGREHVGRLVFGALPRRGDVWLAGVALPAGSPRAAIAAGMAYLPADRHTDGAVMTFNARENLTLARLGPLRRRLGRLDRRAERREAMDWAERLDVRPPALERPLGLFSGGNQQKVVLAKWLRTKPAVLVLDEPTQGVDVGAKAAIYAHLAAVARGGAGVLVSSSDPKELCQLCHRVLVLRDGQVEASVHGAELTEEHLLRESLGLR